MRSSGSDKKFSVFNLGFRQQAGPPGVAPPPPPIPPPPPPVPGTAVRQMPDNNRSIGPPQLIQQHVGGGGQAPAPAPPAPAPAPPAPAPVSMAFNTHNYTLQQSWSRSPNDPGGAPAIPSHTGSANSSVAPPQQPSPQLPATVIQSRAAPRQHIPLVPQSQPIAPPAIGGGYGAGFVRQLPPPENSGPSGVVATRGASAKGSGWRARGATAVTSPSPGYTVVGLSPSLGHGAAALSPVQEVASGTRGRPRGRAAATRKEPKEPKGRKERSAKGGKKSGSSSSRSSSQAPTQLARNADGSLMTPSWTTFRGKRTVTYNGVKYSGTAAHKLWELYKEERDSPSQGGRFTPTQTLATPALELVARNAVSSTMAIMGGLGAMTDIGSPAQTLASNNRAPVAKKAPAKRGATKTAAAVPKRSSSAARPRSPTLAEMYGGGGGGSVGVSVAASAPRPKKSSSGSTKKVAAPTRKAVNVVSRFLDLEAAGAGRSKKSGTLSQDEDDDDGDLLFAPHELRDSSIDVDGSSSNSCSSSSSSDVSSVDTLAMSSDSDDAMNFQAQMRMAENLSLADPVVGSQEGGGTEELQLSLFSSYSHSCAEMELFQPLAPHPSMDLQPSSSNAVGAALAFPSHLPQPRETQQFREEVILLSSSSSSSSSGERSGALEDLVDLQGDIDPDLAVEIAMRRSKSDYKREQKQHKKTEQMQMALALAASHPINKNNIEGDRSITERGDDSNTSPTTKRSGRPTTTSAIGRKKASGSPTLTFLRPQGGRAMTSTGMNPPTPATTAIDRSIVPMNNLISDEDEDEPQQYHPLMEPKEAEHNVSEARGRKRNRSSPPSFPGESGDQVITSLPQNTATATGVASSSAAATNLAQSVSSSGGGFSFSSFVGRQEQQQRSNVSQAEGSALPAEYDSNPSIKLHQDTQILLPGNRGSRFASRRTGNIGFGGGSYGFLPQGPDTQIAGVAMPFAPSPGASGNNPQQQQQRAPPTRYGMQILGETSQDQLPLSYSSATNSTVFPSGARQWPAAVPAQAYQFINRFEDLDTAVQLEDDYGEAT